MSTLAGGGSAELFRQPPEELIDVGGAEVAYRRVGSGPDVLFVHGWPVSSATFRSLLPHLAGSVTCHLVDLPGAGSSRFDPGSTISVEGHIHAVKAVIDHLDLDSVAVVGHDSGGLIARRAVVGDRRVRALGLIDTEQPGRPTWRFRSFLAARHLPGIGAALGWVVGKPALRRHGLVLGGAFVDRSLLDGEFDELFLRPIHDDPARRRAAIRMLRSFEPRDLAALAALHARIDIPVQLVWGAQDAFFPVARARAMVPTFPDARLAVIDDAGLFSHEERPAEVAAALLPILT